VIRHISSIGSWEWAKAAPAESLRPFVREYIGWNERLAAPLCRRELPSDEAPLIINFGAPFRLFAPGESRREGALTSFVTGAYDTYQLVESFGATSGVQVNFTLLGIRLIVGRPIQDMKNGAFAPEDIFGAFARELTGRLYDAPSWEVRVTILDRALSSRLREARDVPPAVRRAWHRLVATSGRSSIASIVQEVGWSQRHFIATFRHEIGISPKVFARILRFSQVVRDLEVGRTDLASAALGAGYCDQSHLNRDARAFAGVTPGQLRNSLLPDDGGFAAAGNAPGT
jgi:AraC-like DNA-binding protein